MAKRTCGLQSMAGPFQSTAQLRNLLFPPRSAISGLVEGATGFEMLSESGKKPGAIVSDYVARVGAVPQSLHHGGSENRLICSLRCSIST